MFFEPVLDGTTVMLFSLLLRGLNMSFFIDILHIWKVQKLERNILMKFWSLWSHESCSVRGHNSKGEGDDFNYENLYRKAKIFTPSGEMEHDM